MQADMGRRSSGVMAQGRGTPGKSPKKAAMKEVEADGNAFERQRDERIAQNKERLGPSSPHTTHGYRSYTLDTPGGTACASLRPNAFRRAHCGQPV